MPGESFIQLPPNSTGLKAHTWQRTVGASSVEDEVVIQGRAWEPTYSAVIGTSGTFIGTINRHVFELINGATKVVRIRRIYFGQATLASAAGRGLMDLYRLSTTGTGGSAASASRHNSGDAVSALTAINQGVTTPGTITDWLFRQEVSYGAAWPLGDRSQFTVDFPEQGQQAIVIPVSGRLGMRSAVAAAGVDVSCVVTWTETDY